MLSKGDFTLTTTDLKSGVYTRTYSAQSQGKSTRFFVTSRTITPPQIVASISNPTQAKIGELLTANVLLNHTGAIPYNISTTMEIHHSSTTQEIDDLESPATFAFTFPARILRPGENKIVATITYVDELGTAGSKTVESTIELTDVGILDKITFALEDASIWLVDLFR
jgi:hypothetical protein